MFQFLNLKIHFQISNFKFQIATALLISFALLANPTKVYGQSVSLSLWPPLLEAMMQPGRSITAAYQLTNNSEIDLLIVPQIHSFEPLGNSGQIKISDQPAAGHQLPAADLPIFSLDSGEKFGEPFLLKLGESRQIILKITIPEKSPEKDHYHTLLFSTVGLPSLPGSSGDGGGASSVAQIGGNILITVSQTGKPILSGKVRRFSAPRIIDSFDHTPFGVILENTGRTFWKPFGSITITGILKQKDEIKLLEQNILAYSSRELTLEPYRPKFPLGPFRANLNFSLNEDGPELSSTVAFWYLPYKLFGLILVFLIVSIIVKKIIKSYKPITKHAHFSP